MALKNYLEMARFYAMRSTTKQLGEDSITVARLILSPLCMGTLSYYLYFSDFILWQKILFWIGGMYLLSIAAVLYTGLVLAIWTVVGGLIYGTKK